MCNQDHLGWLTWCCSLWCPCENALSDTWKTSAPFDVLENSLQNGGAFSWYPLAQRRSFALWNQTCVPCCSHKNFRLSPFLSFPKNVRKCQRICARISLLSIGRPESLLVRPIGNQNSLTKILVENIVDSKTTGACRNIRLVEPSAAHLSLFYFLQPYM